MTTRTFAQLIVPLALAAAALSRPAPAYAFACYVGDSPQGFVAVRKRPDANAPVLARLGPSFMVSDGRRPRERSGWIFVRWSRSQMSQAEFNRGKGDGKGWIRHDDIRGECED